MTDYRKEYERWLDAPALSEEEWRELDAIREDDEQIKSRFRGPLEFGTAGLRGIMGAGLARMNIHVIRWATQAFAALIVAEGDEARHKGVVICYDCRRNSREFAIEAACVCAANGIHVRLFDSLRPTPELSFAVIHYGAAAGINITASHNPKEYNGYKVYWSDGAQLPPQHAAAVAQRMEELDIFSDIATMPFTAALEKGMIEYIGQQTDELFLEHVLAQAIDPNSVKAVADQLQIVYTPFHGAGYKLVPEALTRLGIRHIHPVPQQMLIDGTFPTVESPNPENPEGFYLAVDLARQVGSALIIGTDPDSDRVGVMALGRDGEYHTITGNQMGALLTDYVITARRRTGTLPKNAAVLSTIVSTGMTRAICEANGVHFEETFTGFKFMAEKVKQYAAEGSYQYVMAFEESYGYMMGDYVRDKDAVTASMMIAEMAAYYARQDMTLLDAIDALYEKYGYFAERTINIFMEGVDGPERMAALMTRLRTEPPAELAGQRVIRMRDYRDGTISVPGLGPVGHTELSGSNVLYFELENDTNFVIRPSGTEPKIKIYILARDKDGQTCQQKADACAAGAAELGKE
jgi:phosphoglucomutase